MHVFDNNCKFALKNFHHVTNDITSSGTSYTDFTCFLSPRSIGVLRQRCPQQYVQGGGHRPLGQPCPRRPRSLANQLPAHKDHLPGPLGAKAPQPRKAIFMDWELICETSGPLWVRLCQWTLATSLDVLQRTPLPKDTHRTWRPLIRAAGCH